jgi:hypothetical protein
MSKKDKKVIAWENMPRRSPWMFTAVIYLLLKQGHTPAWLWGVLGTLLAIIWINYIHKVFTVDEEEVDILKDK